jgi:hypothetical protein
MNFKGDIDIDYANRDDILNIINHIPASIRNDKAVKKHPTGIYVTNIPYDPINDLSALDYKSAEDRGYFKLDFLNVHVYGLVKDNDHLIKLMKEPNWDNLKRRKFVEKLIHLNNQFDILNKMPEPINSITRLAMFLAVIRPGKRHLLGQSYVEIAKTIWEKNQDEYVFKKSHAIAYAHLVVVHMNLLEENNEIS